MPVVVLEARYRSQNSSSCEQSFVYNFNIEVKIPVIDPKTNEINARNYLFISMLKTNYNRYKLALKRTSTSILNQSKHKRDTNIVYMTKNCEICILIITPQLPLKIWLIIRNGFIKHYKH